ncbi:MAG TPA: hypothetical protein VGI15_07440, partial [Candidatus Cybelea sp.]
MPRCDPARSPYCATRHLLRNLGQARQLRRNPLAREIFARPSDEALHAVTARVYDSMRAMNPRHAALLLRVDVGRHDPRIVAADLALSRRQFHRERKAAHARFYHVYSGHSPSFGKRGVRPIEVDGDFSRRLLERAASLADSGETSSARAILDDIAASGADGSLRGEALAQLAMVSAWEHRFDRGKSYVRGARQLLASAEMRLDVRERLVDEVDAAANILRWFAEGPEAIGIGPVSGTLRDRERLVRAAAALRSGESTLALALMEGLDERSPALRDPGAAVDLLTLRAELADFTGQNPLLSEELFSCAAAAAQANGLRGREMYATHQLMLTKWMHTRNAQDRLVYRKLVDGIDPSLPPRLRSYLTFSAADVELAIGHPRRALSAARAAGRVSTNPYERFSARGLAAGSLLRLGRVDEAGEQATLAASEARAGGHTRVLSLAQRIGAQVYF